jgi:DNA-binding GntR family transcriptional regulator
VDTSVYRILYTDDCTQNRTYVMSLNTLGFNRMGNLAYQAIRDAILSGMFEQGTRLNQDDLARRLGVSRAPIRDALYRLEAEGLAQTLSRVGGVVVAEMSEQEMVDIFELRAILESHSTRSACERMTEADLARLQVIVTETERVTQAGDLQATIQTHTDFHCLIYAVCGNAELERVARNLWDRSFRFRLIALSNAENARRGLEEHKKILAALFAREPQRAAALAEEHNQESIRHLRPRMTRGVETPTRER